MKPTAYRRALRLALRDVFNHEPGLSIPELMILLHAPHQSDSDIFDLVPRSQGEVAVYVRSLVAQGLLEQGGKRGPYTLTPKSEALLQAERV